MAPHELIETATIVASFVIDNPWVWPGSETFHFIGLSLLFGIVLMVNLRMLGVIRTVPFAAMHRLLPWGILGLVINTITGMLFFVAKPEQYTYNLAFQLKVVFLLLAGGNLLFLTTPGHDSSQTTLFRQNKIIYNNNELFELITIFTKQKSNPPLWAHNLLF